jgi:release factor glutamine methyltransferase
MISTRLMATIGEALARARDSGVKLLDAEVLLGHVLGRARTWLLAHPEETLDTEQSESFSALVERWLSGEPVAYLTGQREFFGLSLAVSPAVLIPRPETEHLVEAALEWAGARQPLIVADAGTGSGAIAVSLAVNLPEARLIATDTSREALEMAARNASGHGVEKRVMLVQTDLLGGLRPPFDLIVSNPPYIPGGQLSELEVARYEPHAALDGGQDGLDVIRRLLADAPRLLGDDGLLLVEIGAGQGRAVASLARGIWPEADIALLPDYSGHERVLRVAVGGTS